MTMRGDSEGAESADATIRGVVIVTGSSEETAIILALARARGLDAVEVELPRQEGSERPRPDVQQLSGRAGRVVGRARYESGIRPSPWLSCGPLCLDSEAGEMTIDGEVLSLRKTERDVLAYLMQNAHRFVTPLELQEQVLKTHGDGGAARNQVYELRRKLRAAGHAVAIETRTHQGYRLRWTG
jgi:hypothetical protein